jgi:hypothetical protein
MVNLKAWLVKRMKGKRSNRQDTGTEHGKITKQATAQHPNRARKSQHFCGAYAFRGPMRIIGEQAPQ